MTYLDHKEDTMKKFGDFLRDLRKKRKFSQNDIYDKTGITCETLRKIENGLCIPNIETLYFISDALSYNLIGSYAEYFYGSGDLKLIDKNINKVLENQSYQDLKNLSSLLSKEIKSSSNPIYKKILRQRELFIQAIIEAELKNRPKDSILMVENALRLSFEKIDWTKLNDIYINDFEEILLMNLGIFLRMGRHDEKSIKILDSLYKKNMRSFLLMYNLANSLYNFAYYEDSISLIESYTSTCASKLSNNNSHLIYYTKAMAEYRLNLEESQDSFSKCLAYMTINQVKKESQEKILSKIKSSTSYSLIGTSLTLA